MTRVRVLAGSAVLVVLSACASPDDPEPTVTPHFAEAFCFRLADEVNEYEDFVDFTIRGGQNAERFAALEQFVDDLRELAPASLIPQVNAYAAPIVGYADDYADGSTPTADAPGWFGVSGDLRTYCSDVLSDG